MTGQSAAEMHGEGWLRAILSEDRAQAEAVWRRAIEHATPFEIEHRVLRTDGTFGWFTNHGTPLRDPGGTIREWVGVMLRSANPSSAPEITGTLLRGARAMLDWSVGELAVAVAAAMSVFGARRRRASRSSRTATATPGYS